jgi:Proteasome maturation factor UMP1
MSSVLPSISIPRTINHPVEAIQASSFSQEEMRELQQAGRTFGLHMVMRLAFEREALSSFRRPSGSGFESGMIGLETAMGIEDDLEVEDIYRKSDFINKNEFFCSQMHKMHFQDI